MPEAMTGIDIRVASNAPERSAQVVARHFGIEADCVAAWNDADLLCAAIGRARSGWVGWHPAEEGAYPSLVSVNWLPHHRPAPGGNSFGDLLPVLQAIRDELGVDIAVPDERQPAPMALLAFRGNGVTDEQTDGRDGMA